MIRLVIDSLACGHAFHRTTISYQYWCHPETGQLTFPHGRCFATENGMGLGDRIGGLRGSLSVPSALSPPA